MFQNVKRALFALLFAVAAVPAVAADLYEPPVYEAPPAEVVYEDYGGWYIRGDVGYRLSKFQGADYITYGVTGCCNPLPGLGSFDFGELKGAFSVGGGLGYQVSKHLRADLTFDYFLKSEFNGQTTGVCGGVACTSVDRSSYRALLMLANAYADLGTWNGFTPYVGGGIGGAYLKWDDLRNTVGGVTTVHDGSASWRFAYAATVGTAYCLTNKLKLDVGYRYAHISGGRMFELAPTTGPGAGPGFDKGINIHEGRAGLRYQFGGKSGCETDVAYEPVPEPIYTK